MADDLESYWAEIRMPKPTVTEAKPAPRGKSWEIGGLLGTEVMEVGLLDVRQRELQGGGYSRVRVTFRRRGSSMETVEEHITFPVAQQEWLAVYHLAIYTEGQVLVTQPLERPIVCGQGSQFQLGRLAIGF